MKGARGPRRRSGGFTLLEILIAATLMALTAVLCWRGLDSVLLARDRIVTASDDLRSMAIAIAQLEDDVRRAAPVRLTRVEAPGLAFAIVGERASPVLEVLRQTGGAGEPARLQRVVWRVRDDGVLERGFAPWGSSAAFTWQPLLAGVARVDYRVWVAPQRTWATAASVAAGGGAPAVPGVGGYAGWEQWSGLELTMQRSAGGAVSRILALRD